MTNNAISPQSPNVLFYPATADANTRSAVKRFISWLDANGKHWATLDLKEYRDYLLSDGSGLSKPSAKKHMERIRARYQDMLHSNDVRDMIQALIPPSTDAANAYAITEETLTRIANNSQYDKRVAIKIPTRARLDSHFHWMTPEEIEALLERIPRRNKLGYRDAAMIALCYSFGLREAEACQAEVEHLNETQDGKRGLFVPLGKGMKERFVQVDELADYRVYFYDWMRFAGIESGLILGGLQPRQLQRRVALYTDATPHDFRRSYAKNLHNAGRSIEYIGQQLGHAKLETTLIYLGMIAKK